MSTLNKGKAISISLGLIRLTSLWLPPLLWDSFSPGSGTGVSGAPCLPAFGVWCPRVLAVLSWTGVHGGGGLAEFLSLPAFLPAVMATMAVLFPSWERSFKHGFGDVSVAFLCMEWLVGLPRGAVVPSPGEDSQDFTTPGTSSSLPWPVLHVIWTLVSWRVAFPGGTTGKEPPCQCKRRRRHRFDPWVGKNPWRRKWQATPVFLPGESHGRRSLVGYSSKGHKELDMTESDLACMQACTHALLERAVKENAFFSLKLWAYLKLGFGTQPSASRCVCVCVCF